MGLRNALGDMRTIKHLLTAPSPIWAWIATACETRRALTSAVIEAAA